jgi:hypothetical protein
MYDKSFNRIKLFWAAEAHKKFMDKKNKNQEDLLDLQTTKRMLTDFLTILAGITALALACAAAIYTAIWFAS